MQKNLDEENLSSEQLSTNFFILDSLKEEIKQEIDRKVEAKKLLETENVEDFKVEDYNTNFYNWSLSFVRKSNCGIDRKALFAEFLVSFISCRNTVPSFPWTTNASLKSQSKPRAKAPKIKKPQNISSTTASSWSF